MSSPRAGNAIIWIAVVIVVIGAALIGYVSVNNNKDETAPQIHTHHDGEQPHTHDNVPEHAHNDQQPHEADHAEAVAHAGHNHAHHEAMGGAQPNAAPVDLTALAVTADDIVIGDRNAPVRIVEYASLSCPHCATMHLEILPGIKQNYVDTGKAYIVFRHFPLNAPALRASMAVDCAAPAQQAAMLNQFFSTQKEWAFDSNYLANISKIAETHGLDAAATEACFANVEKENAVLQSRQVGAALGVQSTPTLFVNDSRLDGAVSAEIITTSIESILNPDAVNAAEGGDKAQETPKE